jgi:hypothetical protein
MNDKSHTVVCKAIVMLTAECLGHLQFIYISDRYVKLLLMFISEAGSSLGGLGLMALTLGHEW